MIPKTIHYCWFGGNSFGKLHKQCLNTWAQLLQDYQLKLWNESNSPMDNAFVKAAYEDKNYAFVSDYVRLYAIYNEGGIYLDTDMYILKSLNPFLNDECFLGIEDEDGVAAGIIGSVPNHNYIGKCLEFYNQLVYDKNLLDETSIPRNMQRILSTWSDDDQSVQIYEEEYFYPYPYTASLAGDRNFKKHLTARSYGVHLWDGSWISMNNKNALRRIIQILKKYFLIKT